MSLTSERASSRSRTTLDTTTVANMADRMPMPSIHCSCTVTSRSQMLARFHTPVAAMNATAAPKKAPVCWLTTFGPLGVLEAMTTNLSWVDGTHPRRGGAAVVGESRSGSAAASVGVGGCPVEPATAACRRFRRAGSALASAAAGLPDRGRRPAVLGADDGLGQAVPPAVELMHPEHLFELGVPDARRLLADPLGVADVGVTRLRQRRPQRVHGLALDDVQDQAGLGDEPDLGQLELRLAVGFLRNDRGVRQQSCDVVVHLAEFHDTDHAMRQPTLSTTICIVIDNVGCPARSARHRQLRRLPAASAGPDQRRREGTGVDA